VVVPVDRFVRTTAAGEVVDAATENASFGVAASHSSGSRPVATFVSTPVAASIVASVQRPRRA